MLTPEEKEVKNQFVRDLICDHCNVTTRLIYRDWLLERGQDEEAEEQENYVAFLHTRTPEKIYQASAYLQRYAKELEIGFDSLIEAVGRFVMANVQNDANDRWEEWIHLDFDTPDIASGDQRAFWTAFEMYTGEMIPDNYKNDRFVSCSC